MLQSVKGFSIYNEEVIRLKLADFKMDAKKGFDEYIKNTPRLEY